MINIDRTATPRDIIDAMVRELVEKDREKTIKEAKQKNVVGTLRNPFKTAVFFTWWAFENKDAVDKLNEKLGYPLTGGKSKATYKEEATKDKGIIFNNEKPDALAPEGIYLGMQGMTYLNSVFTARPPESKFSYDRIKYPIVALGAALPRREHIRSDDLQTTNFEDLRWTWAIKEVHIPLVETDSVTTSAPTTPVKESEQKNIMANKKDNNIEVEELKTIIDIKKDIDKILNNFDDHHKKALSTRYHDFVWTDDKKTQHYFDDLAKELNHFDKYMKTYIHHFMTTNIKNDVEYAKEIKIIWECLRDVAKFKVLMDTAHAKNDHSSANEYSNKISLSWAKYTQILSVKGKLTYGLYFDTLNEFIDKISKVIK